MNTLDGSWLIAATVAVPLLLAVASAIARQPLRLLAWGPLPGLLCALAVPSGSLLELPQAVLGVALHMDALGAIFLALCAFIWAGAGLHAQSWLAGKAHVRGFCVCWQLTLAGSLGVCIAADAITFYLAFSLVSLPAYVLVIQDRQPASLRAGRIYMALAIFGETALLLGLMLVAEAADSVRLDAVREALPAARWREGALLALGAGLGLKCGLVPLHGWLPLAHSAAPAPASAVLSGAIVKAGLVGLLRFLPAEDAWPQVSQWLTVIGLATAYAAVLLGLPQRQPKAVLAYSTMSQMGLMVAVLAASLAQPPTGYAALVLLAVQHGLAKAALFLAAGLLLVTHGRWRLGLLAAAALLGGLVAGFPLSGGALAKLAAKQPLGDGVAAVLAGWSAVGTALLMLRFVYLETVRAETVQPAPVGWRMVLGFGALAAAALLAPWWLALRLASPVVGEVWQPVALWAAAWPILLAVSAAALAAWKPIGWGATLPVGDLAAWCEAAWAGRRGGAPARPASGRPRWAGPPWPTLWQSVQALAQRMADWPVMGATLALLVLAFAGALAWGRS